MMPQRTVSHFLRFPILDQLDVAHTGGRPQVIHDRVRLIETLCRKHVLVRDAFVFVSRPLPIPMKPDVMLPRDFSQSLVIRHSRLLLLYVILSAAKNLRTLAFALILPQRLIRDVSLRSTSQITNYLARLVRARSPRRAL